MIRLSLLLVPLLASCVLARIDQPPAPSEAQLIVARTQDGRDAVFIDSLWSKHRILGQEIEGAKALTVKPGTYVASLECYEDGATIRVGRNLANFEFTVEPGTYLLDCKPTPEDSYGFFIKKQPN